MSFHAQQFRSLIERTLEDFGLNSESAVELLLGTAAAESEFGKYLMQLGGPAIGIFQMEPRTYEWLQGKYVDQFFPLGRRPAEDMEWDLRFAILLARLRYRVVPTPLPEASDVYGLAHYWKTHYNTLSGRGTVENFVSRYRKYVLNM